MEYQPLTYNMHNETNSQSSIPISKTQSVICVAHQLIYIMSLNGLFGYHFQCVMGIYFHYFGLRYIVKSKRYSWHTYISMKSYQLNHITFFNSSNSCYHFNWWVSSVCLGLTDTVTKVKTNPSQKSQRYTSRRNGVPHRCHWQLKYCSA